MSNDIVSEMVGQMGLTPQMADQLQNQQHGGMGGYPMQMTGHGAGPAGPGLPATPEEQMRLMAAAQYPQQQPQYQQPQPPPQSAPEYAESEGESTVISTSSTESDVDLEKVGLNSQPKSLIDSIFDYLKDPLIVMVLFVILSLSQVGDMLKKALPAVVTNNVYYLIGVKALIMGSTFLASKLAIS